MLSNIKESKENTRLGILFRLGESTDFNISKNKRRILSNLYQHIAKYVLEHIKTVTPILNLDSLYVLTSSETRES